VAPDSGFFLNHTNVLGEYVYGTDMASAFELYNASGGLDTSCIAAGHGAGCYFAPLTYNYIESRIFVMNSAVDLWQVQCVLTSVPFETCSGAPGWGSCAANYETCNTTQIQSLITYESNFLTTLRTSPTWSKAGNGGFVYSCVSHVASEGSEYWTGITIDNTTYVDAFNKWWLSSADTPAADNQYLPCTLHSTPPYRCNPTCLNT
jgi:Pectinacetylesterase